jgi:hypothetical protein
VVKVGDILTFFNRMDTDMAEQHYTDKTFEELWELSKTDLLARNEILARQKAHWEKAVSINVGNTQRLMECTEAFAEFLDSINSAMAKLKAVLRKLAEETKLKE